MQVPFPELAALYLSMEDMSHVPDLPDSFLGGSAPRLRYFYLRSIPFPGLPKLLLSATQLVELYLHDIPCSKYMSPEAMVTCLSMLTSLETLQLGLFGSPPSPSYPYLKSLRSFLPTRSVLPTLMKFWFQGTSKYSEEFVARIDAPQLYQLSTKFFIDLDTTELNLFISRTPTLGAYDEARLIFRHCEVLVKLYPERSDHAMVQVKVLYWERSSLAKICTLSASRLLLTIENLYIDCHGYSPVARTVWLDILLPFTAVKNLYLSKLTSPHIAHALQELTGGRTAEVLPALQNVLLEGFQPSEPAQELEGIVQFISARQLTNHPVVISVWDRDRDLV